MRKNHQNKCKNQQGFSLVELAIVMVISGTLFAAAVTGYSNYLEKRQIYSTQAKLDNLNQAMDRFFAEYKRYPCPASPTINPNDENAGIESDCSLEAAVAPTACGAEVSNFVLPTVFNENTKEWATRNVNNQTFSYCVTSGTIDRDGPIGVAAPEQYRIRKGTIPYKTLQIGSQRFTNEEFYQFAQDINLEDATDFNNNQFTYVVTEKQATQDYLPRLGAIVVVDEHYTLPVDPDPDARPLSQNQLGNHADYLIVSHGKSDDGAYTALGNIVAACGAGLPANERENCNNNQFYISSLRYDTGAEETDDMVTFRNWSNYYLWDQSTENDRNIYNQNTGNVGIGTTTPEAKLHVLNGNAVADARAARFFYEQANPAHNQEQINSWSRPKLMAQEFCGNNDIADDTWTECFDPRTIGGDIRLNPAAGYAVVSNSGGLDCDHNPHNVNAGLNARGNYGMSSLRGNVLECATVYDSNQGSDCPANQYIQGFEYDVTTKTLRPKCAPVPIP